MTIHVRAVDGMTSHDAADVTQLETQFLSQEGVVGITGNDLLVEAQASPDMTVKVSPGSCFVLRDANADNDNTLRYWNVIVDAITNVTIPTADISNDRIDLICVKIDTGASPNAGATNIATLVAVEGTPAGSPTAPAVPNNHLKIAEISVPASDTTISSGQITDSRTFIGLQLPYAHGYRLKDTSGSLDTQIYEDSTGKVIIKGQRNLASVSIDQVNNKIILKPGGGKLGTVVGSGVVEVELFAPATAVATGDSKKILTLPKKFAGLRLARVHAGIGDTQSSSGAVTVQIHDLTNGVDLLLTRLTVDANEDGSETAAAPAVIDETRNTATENQRLRFDVDVAGTGTTGLVIRLEYENY